jgi:transcriptional regulator with XRE-family HTH domain
MTVAQLAAAAGVSTGLISQVERDLADPSLETLRKVSKALGVPLFSLFQSGDASTVAVVEKERRVLVRSPSGGVTYSRISPGHGRLEMLEGHLPPGSESSPEPWSHPSEECAVVVRGRLTIEVAGEERVLGAGDSCYFDSSLPHRYANRGGSAVDFIVAITPPSY